MNLHDCVRVVTAVIIDSEKNQGTTKSKNTDVNFIVNLSNTCILKKNEKGQQKI